MLSVFKLSVIHRLDTNLSFQKVFRRDRFQFYSERFYHKIFDRNLNIVYDRLEFFGFCNAKSHFFLCIQNVDKNRQNFRINK